MPLAIVFYSLTTTSYSRFCITAPDPGRKGKLGRQRALGTAGTLEESLQSDVHSITLTFLASVLRGRSAFLSPRSASHEVPQCHFCCARGYSNCCGGVERERMHIGNGGSKPYSCSSCSPNSRLLPALLLNAETVNFRRNNGIIWNAVACYWGKECIVQIS